MFNNTQYSILNIQYSINTEAFGATPWCSQKLQQITDLFINFALHSGPFIQKKKKKKEYLNTITLKLRSTYKFWKVTEKYPLQISYKRRSYCRQRRMSYTHTPSGWCSGILTNTRWKRASNTSGCGSILCDSRY